MIEFIHLESFSRIRTNDLFISSLLPYQSSRITKLLFVRFDLTIRLFYKATFYYKLIIKELTTHLVVVCLNAMFCLWKFFTLIWGRNCKTSFAWNNRPKINQNVACFKTSSYLLANYYLTLHKTVDGSKPFKIQHLIICYFTTLSMEHHHQCDQIKRL